jgi:hypothetical protein
LGRAIRYFFPFDPLAARLVHPVEQGPGLFVPLLLSGDSSLQKLEGLIVTAQILQKTGFKSKRLNPDWTLGARFERVAAFGECS